jgi:hypothetical protein
MATDGNGALRHIRTLFTLFGGLIGGTAALGACSSAGSGSALGGSAAAAGASGSAGSGGSSGSLGTGGAAAGSGADGSAGAAGCTQNVDIVFVMDVSTSMGVFLTKLADEISAVDQKVKSLNLPAPPHYGLVVFVDDVQFISFGQPYADVATLRQDFQTWAAFTSSNTQVSGIGTNNTWPENSLDALYMAASGFQWRPAESTVRIVIHTTDDTFWQGPMSGNGVPITHGYADTVQGLQAAQVRAFTFSAKLGDACECVDVSGGFFAPYQGQKPIAEATGGLAYELDGVLFGQISLSQVIPAAVETSLCQPYPLPR